MKTRSIAASCLTVAFGVIGIGTAVADTTEPPALSHEASIEETTADIRVTSSDALASESLSVLILDDDAETTDPATDDIVFIEQYVLDDTGAIEFRVQLPTAALEDYNIALNTAAGTDRYLASLAGDDDQPEPDDGSTSAPEEDETTAPGGEQDPGSGDATEDESPDSGDASEEPDTTSDAADADDEAGSSSAADSNQQAGETSDSEGFLASTGASILVAAVIALAAIGLGMLLVARRRKTLEHGSSEG